MDGQVGWTDLFWSAQGRLGRTLFLIGAAVLIAIAAIYEAAMGPTLHWLTGWFIYPALIYSGACVLSKRLHDRGRSGWWAALVLFALVAVWPRPHGFGSFVFGVVLVWAGIELGVMPSEAGANRFGPSPLGALTA
ncbi:MAG TPA: DUF805 domain-containing protein [Caulobacteraceae bacterium]|nr:DUF805 domain-containing protein [Caulobacteraceae bacterium]